MECIIGMKFDRFVMLAVDSQLTMGGLVIAKNDENKFYNLTSKMVMAMTGEAGDTTQFAEYIAKNIHLYKIRNGYEMSPPAAAHFTRNNLIKALRSRNPYSVNMLMGGWDDEEGGVLYHMDYLGAQVPVPHAAFGYGGLIALSIMDRYHSSDQDEEAAYELMQRCIKEVQQRIIINTPNFNVAVIDTNGMRMKPVITLNQVAVEAQ